MSVSPSRLGLQVCVLVINIKKEKEKKRTNRIITDKQIQTRTSSNCYTKTHEKKRNGISLIIFPVDLDDAYDAYPKTTGLVHICMLNSLSKILIDIHSLTATKVSITPYF